MDQLPASEIDVFNRTEPRALINLVHPTVAAAMVRAHQMDPDLFGLVERDLFKKLRASERTPSSTDNRMRMSFWMEVDRAGNEGCDIDTSRIYSPVCSKQFFFQHYLNNPSRVAWMLTPVVGYEVKMEEALDFAMDRMRAFLEIDPNPPGAKQPNIKLMELQAKIFAMIDMRLKGGHTQRTESKSLQVNISATEKQVAKVTQELSMEALEKRIRELDKRDLKSQNLIIKEVPSEVADAE